MLTLPRLYPIIDFSCFAAETDPISAVRRFAEGLMGAGATLIKLRDKSQPGLGNPGLENSGFKNSGLENPGLENNVARRFLSCARELRRVALDLATLIINERVDICLAAGADGVHLGQDDLSPTPSRRIFDSLISHAPHTPTHWLPHPLLAQQHNPT